MTGPTFRPLTLADRDASIALSEEAFGRFPEGHPPAPPVWPPAGMHVAGAFDADGALLGKVNGRTYLSWMGGAEIPTWGVAGVAVRAESRGTGLLRPLFEASLAEARERGMALSTLYLTAARLYRNYGYELVGDYVRLEVPTAALGELPATPGLRVRRATAADFPAVHAVYTSWASGQNGPLTRTGPCFTATAEEFIAAFSGVTVVEDDAGEVVGYASWQRGQGYDASATLVVSDLIGLVPGATRALLRVLGSFGTVTGTVRIASSLPDDVELELPGLPPVVRQHRPYMLRVLDLPAAVQPRSFAPGLRAAVSFEVVDDRFGDLDGCWRLEVADGRATVDRVTDDSGLRFTVGGISALYAGSRRTGDLRRAGLVTGGDPSVDADLDAVFGGRGFHVRDYF